MTYTTPQERWREVARQVEQERDPKKMTELVQQLLAEFDKRDLRKGSSSVGADVRREIQALLTVIPLLADDQSASDDLMHILRLASAGTVVDNGIADLETYYPFVRHMRVS